MIKTLYHKFSVDRFQYLRRARQCAELSIPYLMPPEGHSGSTLYETPNQSLVSRGVNNLSAKFLLTLFPPNTPCFRQIIDNADFKNLVEQNNLVAELDEALASVEHLVTNEFEAHPTRIGLFEAFKQLLVSGNVLVYLNEENNLRVFRLDRYVVKRDYDGNVLHIIINEKIDREVLPEDIQKLLKTKEGDVNLYTHIQRKDNNWQVSQEAEDIPVPSAKAQYDIDKSPWLALRFTRTDGENYGRSYVEEYLGDILALDGLSKAVNEASAINSRVIFLVNPNGVTDEADLAKTPNGGFCIGRRQDVETLQVEKQNDLRTAEVQIQTLSERLSYAFLLHTAIQGDAERVTAEEIRYMAQELETSLGGIYTVLGQELQLPLIKRLMYQMERSNKLPKIPSDDMKTVVITGIEALGRGNDNLKLNQFFQTSGTITQLPMLKQVEAHKRVASSLGIESKGLIKTEEDLQQEQQQQQQQQSQQTLMDKGTAPAINAMSQQNQQQG